MSETKEDAREQEVSETIDTEGYVKGMWKAQDTPPHHLHLNIQTPAAFMTKFTPGIKMDKP